MAGFTRSFITGSWAYGSPDMDHEYCSKCCRPMPGTGSDVDLVVLVSKADLEILIQESDDSPDNSAEHTSISLRFGNLNLICETSDAAFRRWKIGTRALKILAYLLGGSVAREFAVNLFEKLRRLDGWDGFVHTFEFLKMTAKGIRDGMMVKIK